MGHPEIVKPLIKEPNFPDISGDLRFNDYLELFDHFAHKVEDKTSFITVDGNVNLCSTYIYGINASSQCDKEHKPRPLSKVAYRSIQLKRSH